MGKKNKKRPERPPMPTEIGNASKMHYEVYLKAKKKKVTSTHWMILFYAVECRLKELFYREFGKKINKKGTQYYDLVRSHQVDILIKKLIKELKLPNVGTCPKAKLNNGLKNHDIECAHLFWRYGYVMEDASEKALVRWIEGVYKKLKKSGGHL